MARSGSRGGRIDVETFTHGQAKRCNIPTAELQSLMREEEAVPKPAVYPRKYNPDEHPEMYARNPDLDPQLVWRGKDEQDRQPLTVDTVPIYVQEKIHPKAIIDDLKRVAQKNVEPPMRDLFADFNGLPDAEARYEFYAHAANWSNRMILGDSLLVMNSLAEKEGLRGQVQMIYIDPPYGIGFASNWQASTKTRDLREGRKAHVSREPEVVKAFRDTWSDGANSYLPYLRDRLVASHMLLAETGSIFVQMGENHVHSVRSILDEVFGPQNFISQISFQTTSGFEAKYLSNLSDFLLWYAKNKEITKFRRLYQEKQTVLGEGNARWIRLPDGSYRGVKAAERRGEAKLPNGAVLYKPDNIISQGSPPSLSHTDSVAKPMIRSRRTLIGKLIIREAWIA
jgi:adenine-specific DNA-methyltransferase